VSPDEHHLLGVRRPIASALVLAAVAGAAAAAAAFDRPDRQGRGRLVDTLVAVVVVLAGCAAALQWAGEGLAPSPRTALTTAVVAAAAAAMGAQATAIRRAGGVSVLTTASTGSITSLGVELGRHRGSMDPVARTRAARLLALVLCYVGGAALSVHTARGPELLVVPCLALAALLVAQLAQD